MRVVAVTCHLSYQEIFYQWIKPLKQNPCHNLTSTITSQFSCFCPLRWPRCSLFVCVVNQHPQRHAAFPVASPCLEKKTHFPPHASTSHNMHWQIVLMFTLSSKDLGYLVSAHYDNHYYQFPYWKQNIVYKKGMKNVMRETQHADKTLSVKMIFWSSQTFQECY